MIHLPGRGISIDRNFRRKSKSRNLGEISLKFRRNLGFLGNAQNSPPESGKALFKNFFSKKNCVGGVQTPNKFAQWKNVYILPAITWMGV